MYSDHQVEQWLGKSKMRRVREYTVKALNVSTRKRLGYSLDKESNNFSRSCGIQQDWQGLAELMGFGYSDIQHIQVKEEKTVQLLDKWSQKSNTTIGQLLDFLEQLERFDVLEDSIFQKRIMMDVDNHIKREEEEKRRYNVAPQPVQVPEVDSQLGQNLFDQKCTPDYHGMYDEYKNITIQEIETGKPEFFDAFICYTNSDLAFVKQVIHMLEGIHGLRLCIPDRDITPGCAEHTIMTYLIAQRCKKMVIIVSSEYLKSPECDFMTKFGHSLAPGARSKKLIPVLIERSCPIPDILSIITLVDYTKFELVEWFWRRLAKALQESSITMAQLSSPSAVQQANAEGLAQRQLAREDTKYSTAMEKSYHRSKSHISIESGQSYTSQINKSPVAGPSNVSSGARNMDIAQGPVSMVTVTGQYGGYVPLRQNNSRTYVMDSGLPPSLRSRSTTTSSLQNSDEDLTTSGKRNKKTKQPKVEPKTKNHTFF